MLRCLELARKGAGYTAPNPMVGAVMVDENSIIGEGWHEEFGKAHAEVNCIQDAIRNGNSDRINRSTLYVSLEPCAHFGKTPPCADLIIQHKIPNVVIGCRDPFKEVNTRMDDAVSQEKGIERLTAAGVTTTVGILEDQCKELNRRFITFQKQKRPYIILKWAETVDHKMGTGTVDRLLISNEYTNRLVHKWRSEESAILVGTNTALLDDPELTTRYWTGPSPVRLVIDMELKLPSHLKLFNSQAHTIVFNAIRHDIPESPRFQSRDRTPGKIMYYQVTHDLDLVHQIVNALYQLNIQSVMVEGGAILLQSFINEGIWDEARRIVNSQLTIGKGLNAPELKNHTVKETINISPDIIEIFDNETVSLTY